MAVGPVWEHDVLRSSLTAPTKFVRKIIRNKSFSTLND